MDTLAHTLLGVAIGLVAQHTAAADLGGAASATGQALFWGSVVAAQVPDLDLITMVRSRLNHIRDHHGLTHSLPGAVVLAVLVAGWAWLWWPGAVWTRLVPWMLIAVIGGHVIPDWLTAFGTRLLLPFRNDFLALDWLAQTEPIMMALLLVAVTMAWRNPDHAAAWASAGLGASVLFVLWRGFNHRRIHAQLRRYYRSQGPVLRVSAQPHPWGLTRYQYTVDTPGICHLGSAWTAGNVREQARVRRPSLVPFWRKIAHDGRVARILRFTRNPIIRARRLSGDNWLFEISDFRGGCAFHFAVTADHKLRVQGARRVV